MHRTHRMGVALLLAATMFSSGCYGPFLLTRKVWKFNKEVSDNKWVVEVVYLVCTWLPVYGVAVAADAIIFNSVEFWTGKNPMVGADAKDIPQTKRIVRKDSETVLTRIHGPNGDELVIQQLQRGQPGPSARIRRQGDSMIVLNGDGATLLSAQTLTDGSVAIRDASGRQLASYSKDQAERFLKSVRQ